MIVYAGAIIVTFLFVIMLAQSEGQAIYDRMARAPGGATFSAFALLWAVFYALLIVRTPEGPGHVPHRLRPPALGRDDREPGHGPARLGPGRGDRPVDPADGPPRVRIVGHPGRRPRRTWRGWAGPCSPTTCWPSSSPGRSCFVALIGAIAIATPKTPVRPGTREAVAAGDPAQARAIHQANA